MTDSTDTNAAANDAAHADIGMVCALPIELGAFRERCERERKYVGGPFVFRGGRLDGIRIAIVESSVGFARARRATQSLIEAHSPSWVISAGFSGALQPSLKVGEIVIADVIADTHGNELTLTGHFPEQDGLHTGRVITADDLVRTVDEKAELGRRLGGLAVDMESLAVAQVCAETGTRFLCIRVISDDMSSDLPPEVLTVLGSTGSQRMGAALGAIWKRPSSVKELWHLRESALQCADRLAKFLDGVVRQLHSPSD